MRPNVEASGFAQDAEHVVVSRSEGNDHTMSEFRCGTVTSPRGPTTSAKPRLRQSFGNYRVWKKTIK
jgi:hypothetical protein